MAVIGKQRGVTIQIKDQSKTGSLSLTVHNKTVKEIYENILFMFESLEKNGEAVLYFYNTKNKRMVENDDGTKEVQTFDS